MDTEIQAKAYANADFSLSDKAFIKVLSQYLFQTSKTLEVKSLIVDLGCGPGNVTERLALKWPHSKVIGIDGSEAMLDIARDRKRQIFSQHQGPQYLLSDIRKFANGSEQLYSLADLIVSNSFLHHLHEPSIYWTLIKRMSRRGSTVFLRDLRRPQSEEEAIRLQQKLPPNDSDILKRDFLASLKAAFTVGEVKQQIKFAGMNNLNVVEVGDRYLEVIGTI